MWRARHRSLRCRRPAEFARPQEHLWRGGACPWRGGVPTLEQAKARPRCVKNEAEHSRRALPAGRPSNNEQVRHPSRPLKVNRARSPKRVLTPLSGILGTHWVGKPPMKLWPCRRSTRKDGEEMEVLRGSLHGVVWVLQAAQLHLRLQKVSQTRP